MQNIAIVKKLLWSIYNDIVLQLLQADLTVEANHNRYQLPLTQFSYKYQINYL